MTEDTKPKATKEESVTSATATKPRKRRKWDQPAEALIAAGIAIPGVPMALGSLPGIALLSGSNLSNPVPTTLANSSQLLQQFAVPHMSVAQKMNQPKIQDELIAREIVINDAEPTVRFKLTKRQTQEEIQKCTGAVVITRGKYRPPNGFPDSEKPLYLRISSGTHLKDTAERIRAVDHAAAMIEEILRQGQVAHPLSICVFLGFDVDPSLDIEARIRGPNDQYINHIMNETGATVVLRGQRSENSDTSHAEARHQSLHLNLSSNNSKSLEHAKVLAENLLDTIAVEFGASRVISSNVYSAVPPPQQLLTGVENVGTALAVNGNQLSASSCSTAVSMAATGVFASTSVPLSLGSTLYPPAQPATLLNSQQNLANHSQSSITGVTSYNGYCGIYPQATPLQQVALALKHASPSTAAVLPPTSQSASAKSKPSSSEPEKRPQQKRKFQELPAKTMVPPTLNENSQQRSEFIKPGSESLGTRTTSAMPPRKKMVEGSNVMPPPPPRNMSPPPPKFPLPSSSPGGESKIASSRYSTSPPSPREMPPPPPKLPSTVEMKNLEMKSTPHLSDTVLKLVEYGEEDDDDEEDNSVQELRRSNATQTSTPKPFWAV